MYKLKNNAKSIINMGGGLSAGATSLTVASGSVFPSTFPFLVTLWDKIAFSDPSDDSGMEIVEVSNRVSNVLTIVRAKEGTTDKSHANAEAVEMLLTAGHLQEITAESHASVEANSGTVAPASYTQRVRLTFVPTFSGEFMLEWYTEMLPTNNKYVALRIQQDDTTILGESQSQITVVSFGTDCVSRSGFCPVTLVAGTTYNFDMDYHSNSINMQIQRSRLWILAC